MFLQSLTSRTWKKNKSTCSLELLCITSAEQSQVSCGKHFSFWFFHEWCNSLQNKVHRTNFCTWKMKTCQREDRQAKKEGTKIITCYVYNKGEKFVFITKCSSKHFCHWMTEETASILAPSENTNRHFHADQSSTIYDRENLTPVQY